MPSSGRKLTQVWVVALSLVLAAFALAACGKSGDGSSSTASSSTASEPTSEERTGGDLVWAKPEEIDTFDPILGGLTTSAEFQQLVYERLVDVNGIEVEPQLAESWEQPAPNQYVFTLQKGATFSNGRAMTVDDVVGSLERAIGPDAIIWGPRLGITKVEAVGKDKVKVTLDGPRTDFLASLANAAVSIVPMKEVEDGSFDPTKEMLGTGPFMVAAHKKDDYWTFVPNPYHADENSPRVDKLTVKIMPEDAARIAGLRDGSVDVTTFTTPDAVPLLAGQSNVEVVPQKTTDFYRLDMNAFTSMFKDKRLREAVSLGIDRQEIADVAFGGEAEPTAALTQSYGEICDAADMPFAEPDVEKAKELVKEAGAEGKTITINSYNVLVPMSKPIAEVVQKQLEAIGFNVKIESLEAGEAFAKVFGETADFDLSIGSSTGYPDPAMGLRNWNPEEVGWNVSFLRPNATITKLVGEANKIPAGEQRDEDLKKVCEEIAADANVIPLVTLERIIAYRSDLVEPDIQDIETYAIPLRYVAGYGLN